MSELSLVLKLQLPERKQAPAEAAKTVEKCTPEEQVRKLLEICERGDTSPRPFILLKKIHTALCEKKQTERVLNLRRMIEPLLGKYGYHSKPEENEEK